MKAEKNPFRSSAIGKLRYRMSAGDRVSLVANLRDRGWRGCILGPEGTGKTTLLEDIAEEIRESDVSTYWVRLTLHSSPAERREAIVQALQTHRGECCLFDGGEVLGWFTWRRLIRRVTKNGAGLIATVHRPCPLPVVYRTGADSSRTLALAKELAGDFWSPGMEETARRAFHENGGNAREVFRACYWHCAAV